MSEIKIGRFYVDGGSRPVVVKVADKWMHVVYLDGSWIKVKREPVKEMRYFTEFHGSTVKKVCKLFLRQTSAVSGCRREITKAAKAILMEGAK